MITGRLLPAGMRAADIPSEGEWYSDALDQFFFQLPEEVRHRCRVSGSGPHISSVSIRGGPKVYDALAATGTRSVAAMWKMNRICTKYGIDEPLPKVARRFQYGFGSPQEDITSPAYHSCRGGIQWCKPGYHEWVWKYDIIEAYSSALCTMLPVEFRQIDGYETIDRRSSICQHTLYYVKFRPKDLPVTLSADKVTRWIWGCELFECAERIYRIYCSYIPTEFRQMVKLRHLIRPLRKRLGNMIVGQNMKKTRWLYLPRPRTDYIPIFEPFLWRKATRGVQQRTRYDISGLVTAKVRAQLWRMIKRLKNPFETLVRVYVDEICCTERLILSSDKFRNIKEVELGPARVYSPTWIVYGEELEERQRMPGED